MRLLSFAVLLLTLFLYDGYAAYPDKLVSFGLVADNHFDTFPAGEQAPWEPDDHWKHEQVKRTTTVTGRRYDLAVDKMDETINFFNTRKDLDFVMNLGDIVNNDLMWNLKPILDSFNRAKAPHFHILGNHDRRAHNDRFGEKNTTQEKWLMGKLGLKQWHYTFSVPPFRFICLDSMLMEDKKDPRRAEYIRWLDKELHSAEIANEHVIIFGHIVVGLGTNVLGPILNKYSHIVAMFYGHHHKGGYTKQGKSIHTVIIQGQIETMSNAFALVEVYYDRIEMTGFGRVPTRVFRFEPSVAAKIKEREEKHLKSPEARNYDLGSEHQPSPPAVLWNDPLEVMPPIKFPLQNYVKPSVPKALPNSGSTRFYSEWKGKATPAEVLATETQLESATVQPTSPSTKQGGSWKVTTHPVAAVVTSDEDTSSSSTNPVAATTVKVDLAGKPLDLWSYVLIMPSMLLCLLGVTLGAVRACRR
jgi:predicted phosphodiesterase